MSKFTSLNTLLAFEVGTEKHSPVGGTKLHPTTKERDDDNMRTLQMPKSHPQTSSALILVQSNFCLMFLHWVMLGHLTDTS